MFQNPAVRGGGPDLLYAFAKGVNSSYTPYSYNHNVKSECVAMYLLMSSSSLMYLIFDNPYTSTWYYCRLLLVALLPPFPEPPYPKSPRPVLEYSSILCHDIVHDLTANAEAPCRNNSFGYACCLLAKLYHHHCRYYVYLPCVWCWSKILLYCLP